MHAVWRNGDLVIAAPDFNEPLFLPSTDEAVIDQYLHDSRVRVEYAEKPDPALGTGPLYQDITANAKFRVDSGARRILMNLGSLQLGGYYRSAQLSLRRCRGQRG